MSAPPPYKSRLLPQFVDIQRHVLVSNMVIKRHLNNVEDKHSTCMFLVFWSFRQRVSNGKEGHVLYTLTQFMILSRELGAKLSI